MSDNITFNTLANVTLAGINRFLRKFTTIEPEKNIMMLIKKIESMYPFIFVTRTNSIHLCQVIRFEISNKDIIEISKKVFVDLNYEQDAVTIPTLCISKLGYDFIIEKNNYDKCLFKFNYEAPKYKLYVLDIIYFLVNKLYVFFDDHSSPNIIMLMRNEILIKNANLLLGMFVEENKDCDGTIRKINTILKVIDKNVNDNINTNGYEDCEGYSSLIIMAILLVLRMNIYYEDYIEMTDWFKKQKVKLDNKTGKYNKKTRVGTNKENRTFYNFCMAFFVMEDAYNKIFGRKFYDLDCWS